MPGKWDTSTKHLMSENPEHFIKWLLPGATFKGKAKHKSPNLNDRQIEADNLYAIILNSLRCLIHIEFQSTYDKHMAWRMWEYNTLATFKYKLPTYSFVIYLKKCTVTKPEYIGIFPDGRQVHHFHFTVIKLWETSVEMLKQTGLVGIFPLMVLAQDGKRPEVVEEVITSIESIGGKSATELLSLTYIFASLVFEKEVDRDWLKWRFKMLRDVLRGSWAYQEIMQEGALQEQRLTLLEVVQSRFPDIEPLAKKTVDSISDLAVLRRLIVKMSVVETEAKAKQVLLEISKDKKQK